MPRTTTATLPAWLTEELPAPRPILVIGYNPDEDNCYVQDADGNTVSIHDNLQDAYDSCEQEPEKYTLHAHPSLKQHDLIETMEGDDGPTPTLATTTDRSRRPEDPGCTSRLLFFGSEEHSLDLLHHAWESFQKVAKRYKRNKNDFVAAYNFLNNHPAFWLKRLRLDRSDLNEDGTTPKTIDWVTNEGLSGLYQAVWKKNGRTRILLEHGGHVQGYSEHSLDHRLDVIKPTYEKAIIALAKNVHKHYNMDGTDKNR